MRHDYRLRLAWTGNRGSGTETYRGYGRDHTVSAVGLPDILGSADRTFHGDATRWNPEQLFVAAIAQCHMLTFLHLAVKRNVTVVAYDDEPSGTMVSEPNGSGQFTSVTLHPSVTIACDEDQSDELIAIAQSLHGQVPEYCFIARSVIIPIGYEPVTRVSPRD